MKLTVKPTPGALKSTDTLAVIATEESLKKGLPIPRSIAPPERLPDLDFVKGKAGETHFFPLPGGPNIILACLGAEKDADLETVRNAAGAVTDMCRGRSVSTLHAILPVLSEVGAEETLRAAAEGILLANYSFTRYKSGTAADSEPLLEKCSFYGDVAGGNALLDETMVIAENTLLCRDLINETSYNSNSVKIAAEAKRIAKSLKIRCKVLGKKEIESLKMGLLLAVNSGSDSPPQLVIMSYRGDPGSGRSIALVGKGITFDSGGMNLKPSGHIESMRSDMSGAAAVIYALRAAAQMKLKKNIHAVIPLTDNMLSNRSYRPGDIFTAYNRKTVEIGNTDAEGRLVLADAISYIEKTIKPDGIIDMATLTGACIIALGECVAAYLTENEELAGILEESSSVTGEKIWRLPLVKEYGENLKSDFADLCNISSEKNAGTIMGALFIKNFVASVPWAHIDIAGTSWYSRKRGYMPKNATGYGVRLLVEAVKRWR